MTDICFFSVVFKIFRGEGIYDSLPPSGIQPELFELYVAVHIPDGFLPDYHCASCGT